MEHCIILLCVGLFITFAFADVQVQGTTSNNVGSQGEPSPCCFPFKFQATIVPLTSFSIDNQKVQRVSRDWERRLQVQESVVISPGGQQTVEYRVIADYGQMVQYIVSSQGCQARQITYGMLEPCMPANARYLGKTYVGQHSDTANIDGWYYHKTDQNRDVEMTVAVTADGCVPVMEHITGSLGTAQANTLALFTNLTEVVDANVFEIPQACHPVGPM